MNIVAAGYPSGSSIWAQIYLYVYLNPTGLGPKPHLAFLSTRSHYQWSPYLSPLSTLLCFSKNFPTHFCSPAFTFYSLLLVGWLSLFFHFTRILTFVRIPRDSRNFRGFPWNLFQTPNSSWQRTPQSCLTVFNSVLNLAVLSWHFLWLACRYWARLGLSVTLSAS